MDFGSWDFAVFRYGSTWRKYRRMFHSQMHSNAVHKYRSVQMRQARLFLQQLVTDSSDISASVRGCAFLLYNMTSAKMMSGHRVVGATIIDVVYGIQVTGMDDPQIAIAGKVLQLLGLAMIPGSFLVDVLPFRAFHYLSSL